MWTDLAEKTTTSSLAISMLSGVDSGMAVPLYSG
jgi:hypothetical protein